MSVQNQTIAGATSWTQAGVSGANAALTLTVAADTNLTPPFTFSKRQIVMYGMTIIYANNSASAVAASAILAITTTGFQNTPSWGFSNNFPAWSSTLVAQLNGDAPWGGLAVPLITGDSAGQTAATIICPAGGAGIVCYAVAFGVYV